MYIFHVLEIMIRPVIIHEKIRECITNTVTTDGAVEIRFSLIWMPSPYSVIKYSMLPWLLCFLYTQHYGHSQVDILQPNMDRYPHFTGLVLY